MPLQFVPSGEAGGDRCESQAHALSPVCEPWPCAQLNVFSFDVLLRLFAFYRHMAGTEVSQ